MVKVTKSRALKSITSGTNVKSVKSEDKVKNFTTIFKAIFKYSSN